MPKTDSSNIQAHYLPRVYLRQFGHQDRLDVIMRADGSIRPNQHISKVARMRGLYSFKDSEGKVVGDLEEEISQNVEGPLGPILANLNTAFPYVPTGSQRFQLAQFIALQHLRTPERMRHEELTYDAVTKLELMTKLAGGTEIHDALSRAGVNASPQNIKLLKEFATHPERFEFALPKVMTLLHMLKMLPTITRGLLLHGWSVIAYDSTALITGDHPLILIPYASSPSIYNRGVGFANAKEIWFPLSSTRLLVMRKVTWFRDDVLRNMDWTAKAANEYLLESSYQEVYAHPLITPSISGRRLGDRPLMTIEGPEKFLSEYNKPPTRKMPRR